MKIFLKRPDITSADSKEDEEQSRQPTQPSRMNTDTKSLLSKKTKSAIAKSSPSTAKTSVKTRSKAKSGLTNNKPEVSSSSNSASSDVTMSSHVATSAEALTGGTSSLAANVSSAITTMLSAKLHADASSSTSFTSQQQASKARGKIREGDRTSDESLRNCSIDEIQERTLEVIAAYEEIGNAFKRAAVAVEKLKTILPPGISIVIPQLPLAPEIPESQPSEEFINTSTVRPSTNAASSSASNNASIQNILNDTSSDNGIWEFGDINLPTWMNHGDSSTWASKETPIFVDDDAKEDASSPFSFQDTERTDKFENDINKSICDSNDGTSGGKITSVHNVGFIDDNHFGISSELLNLSNVKEAGQDERQGQPNICNGRIERDVPINRELAAKIGGGARVESSSNKNSGDVNGKEPKRKGRPQNSTRNRTAPYTITGNGKPESGTFDYSNTNFTDEEILILEEFNKYYDRRMLTDKSTKQSKVATEISSMAPKVTFEQTAVSKLIRRVKVPKDPATIKALEKWISNERAKEVITEQQN